MLDMVRYKQAFVSCLSWWVGYERMTFGKIFKNVHNVIDSHPFAHTQMKRPTQEVVLFGAYEEIIVNLVKAVSKHKIQWLKMGISDIQLPESHSNLG